MKEKEELWKLKYFTMQKYNLQKILYEKPWISIVNWREFGSVSLEKRHLHRFCKVFQTVEERFMLYEVPVIMRYLWIQSKKKLCQFFLQKQPAFWTLMDQKFSKTLIFVAFCFREFEIPSILHPIQSNNIVVLFRFGSNCIISKCQNF
jgi:hypothetical protein